VAERAMEKVFILMIIFKILAFMFLYQLEKASFFKGHLNEV